MNLTTELKAQKYDELLPLLLEICDLAFNVERPRGESESFDAHKKLRRMIGYKMPYPGYD